MTPKRPDDQPTVRNDVSAPVHGPLIQAGTVGDVHYHAPADMPPLPPAPPFPRRLRTARRVAAVMLACCGAAWAMLRWWGPVDGPLPGWVGAAALPAAVLMWMWWPGAWRHDDWRRAQRLAVHVANDEGDQQLLLTGGEHAKIDLRFRHVPTRGAEAENAVAEGHLMPDTDGEGGIGAYYRALRPGRLVITGPPGAGKTTAALELLIDLASRRAPDSPVPVRVPLSGWDPATTQLTDLLIDHLVRVYDYPPSRARQFIEDGLVLPILDGLDEMDPPRSNGSPDPAAPRAREALRRLNELRRGAHAGPVVVTCRSDLYTVLGKRAGNRPAVRLKHAAHITIEGVRQQEARAFLAARVGEPERLGALFTGLTARPRVAEALLTPWRLSLAAAVYAESGDPAELTRFTSTPELDRFLLDAYIPAVVDVHERRGYRSARVHRWLNRLARHVTSAEGKGRDLFRPHELWVVPGRWTVAVPYLAVVATVAFAFLRLVPEVTGASQWDAYWLTFTPVLVAIWVLFTEPRRLQSPWRLIKRWPAYAAAFIIPTIILIPWQIYQAGLIRGSLYPVYILYTAWMYTAMATKPEDTASSVHVLRDDVKVACGFGVMGGATILFSGAAHGELRGSIPLAVGYALYSLLFFSGANLRYRLSQLCFFGRLPLLLKPFLDWSVQAGLLRRAGSAYQFRHRELQVWLAANPTPPASPGEGRQPGAAAGFSPQ
ncbi:NACHT domain-containing protein [Streptomyces canus]|uniref:NACHT domain-containing protein n=1 Tax=Streptomyces canus TaxID=58343 RepID=UPI00386A8FAE|nr:NACHT domain-containing protein [Streptomyces canus]